MYIITIDLKEDLAILVPVDGEAAGSFSFKWADTNQPGCMIFYGEQNTIPVKIIPWTSIEIINFINLAEDLQPIKEKE